MKYLSLLIVALLLSACGGEQKAIADATTPTTVTPQTPTPSPKPAAKPAANKPAPAPQTTSGKDIEWLTLAEVQQKVKKEPRKILVDVYTPWCGPCKMMMRSTFKDANLINYLDKNYYAVKFNGESGDPITFKGKEYKNPNYNPAIPETRRNAQHQFTQSLGLRGYPTLFIFDPSLNKIKESVGMKSAPQLMEVLKTLEG